MPRKSTPPVAGAEKQLKVFIEKFAPEQQQLIRAIRRAVRKRLPAANELVYDNYNFFVIGYCSSDRPSDAIVSIVASAKGISFCFIHGAKLPDPKRVLLGSGKQTRFIRLPSADVLGRPEVEALIAAAVDHARVRLPSAGRGKLVVRAISAKQRPRRKVGVPALSKRGATK